MFMISGIATAQSTWYEIEYSSSYTSGGIFIVTTCIPFRVQACNMPGSIHRSDIRPNFGDDWLKLNSELKAG